jgi:L-lactate dehydrogenase (cytochrome)
MTAKALNIDDVRDQACRRLPRGIFQYIDRGAEDEVGLANLRRAFDEVTFNPRVLADVSGRNLETSLLGRPQPMPLAIAPTAAAGLVWHEGEIALARAASKAGIPFCIATGSITAMERIAEASPGPLWFQLYVWHDRALSDALIDRAWGNGIETLILTVDTATLPNREYNARNGYAVPVKASWRGGIDMIMHPRWVWHVLLRYIIRGWVSDVSALSGRIPLQDHARGDVGQVGLNPALTWDDLRELRRRWRGKLIVKGVLRVDDARKAADAGVDAIVVSNHGARNLDGAVAPIRALPAIAAAIGDRIEILADSGVRRGADVVKLLALGANAVLIGRAALYGTAVGGEAGAARVLDLLRDEMKTTLGLLGCAGLRELDASYVNAAR